MERENERRPGQLEQHIGTILQVVVAGLLFWVASSVFDMSKRVAVLEIHVQALNTTIQQGTQDRYRGTDAARDFKAVYDEMIRLDRRMEKIEARPK